MSLRSSGSAPLCSLVTEHKEKTLATIFNDHVLPAYLDTPTDSSTDPNAPLLSMLVEAFPLPPPSSTCPRLLTMLTSLHPNNNMMWCCFLGYFSRVSRDFSDAAFTETVDNIFEKFEERERCVTRGSEATTRRRSEAATRMWSESDEALRTF